MNAPTRQTYGELQKAFDHFNRRLFRDALPPCVITLQRFHRSRGYFIANGWRDEDSEVSDEIALNPAYVVKYVDKGDLAQPLSTLVHEMVHGWQHHFGTAREERVSQQGMGVANAKRWFDPIKHGKAKREGDRLHGIALRGRWWSV